MKVGEMKDCSIRKSSFADYELVRPPAGVDCFFKACVHAKFEKFLNSMNLDSFWVTEPTACVQILFDICLMSLLNCQSNNDDELDKSNGLIFKNILKGRSDIYLYFT